MITVGELKINVTTCGLKELDHLLAVLNANVDVLPMIVVHAMQDLADSVGAEKDSKWPELVGNLDPVSQCALARTF